MLFCRTSTFANFTTVVALTCVLLGCRAAELRNSELTSKGSDLQPAADAPGRFFYCLNHSSEPGWPFWTMTLEHTANDSIRVRQVDDSLTFDDANPAHAYKAQYEFSLSNEHPRPPFLSASAADFSVYTGSALLFMSRPNSGNPVFDPALLNPMSGIFLTAKTRFVVRREALETLPSFGVGLALTSRPGSPQMIVERTYSMTCYRRPTLVSNQLELSRAVYDALEQGDLNHLKEAVARGAYINGSWRASRTASPYLHAAIGKQSHAGDEMALWLLDQPGIDVLFRDEDISFAPLGVGLNAFDIAISFKRRVVLEKIIARLTDDNLAQVAVRKNSTYFAGGQFPLALALSGYHYESIDDAPIVIDAPGQDVLAIVERLLASGAKNDVSYCIDSRGSSSLLAIASSYPIAEIREPLRTLLIGSGARSDGTCSAIPGNTYDKPRLGLEAEWALY